MRSELAELIDLVLPAGATDGQRIVLDGLNGRIEVYDSDGLLRIRLGFADAIELSSGDTSENLMGDLQAFVNGAGSTRQLGLVAESPRFSGRVESSITLLSESFDGTVEESILYTANFHRLLSKAGVDPILEVGDALDSGSDIKRAGKSLPRGKINPTDRLVSPSSTFTTTETLIKTATAVTLVSGRRYKVVATWNSVQSDVANDKVELRLRENWVNSGSPGTQYMHNTLYVGNQAGFGTAGGTLTRYLDCPDDISAGSRTFSITGIRAGGTGNCRLNASSTSPMEISIEDEGEVIT